MELDAGTFDTQVLEAGLDVNFTANPSWANLVQFDNDSDILGVQSRFRWILKPGNDLFVVVNKGWQDLDDRFRSVSSRLNVKFQYTFRF